MGTTAEKLAYLSATKNAIRQAIIAKGVEVGESVTFREYAEKIAQIGDVPKLYGYRVKQSEANPFDRVEYLFDAVDMTPAGLDTSDTFSIGSWGDVWFVKDNFPCMVTADGAVDYKLDKTNHTLKEDGTASDVANTSYNGNAMSAIPTVWVKRYTEDGYRYFIACNTQYDETFKAYAHTRPDGTVSPFMYMPMYKGSLVGGKLRSLSGQRPQSSTTGTQELAYAKANGDRWGLRTWMADELVTDLLVLIGKSTNLQLTFGQGHSTGGSSASSFLDTGTLNNAGQFAGKRSNTVSQVKTFYIEGLWAERWDRQEGMVFNNGVYYVKTTPENGGYNFDGTGYTSAGTISVPSNGFVKEFTQNEYGAFPSATGGSETTYECDYFYQSSGLRVPLRGGNCYNGGGCGRCVCVDSAVSYASGFFGASPFLQNPS